MSADIDQLREIEAQLEAAKDAYGEACSRALWTGSAEAVAQVEQTRSAVERLQSRQREILALSGHAASATMH